MTLPLASILLPTYNRAYCLPSVIDSVLGQGYRTFELLIVDDGSNDGTADLIARQYGGDSLVRYHRRVNGGVSAARNTAIELAKGEVLVFCDSDDVWLEHKLLLQMAVFAKFPDVNLVWSDVSAVDPEGKVLHERYTRVCYPAWQERPIDQLFDRSEEIGAVCPPLARVFPGRRIYAGDIFSTMLIGTLINMPAVAVRRALLPRIGNFDESMVAGEDYDFNLRASSAGRVAFIDAPTVLYRVGAPDQLTRPSLHFHQARNWFRTATPFLESGRIPPGLSSARLRAALAGKYYWLGRTELLSGDRRAARAALWQSIRLGQRSRRALMSFVATFLPTVLVPFLSAAYRKMTSIGRR